MALKLIEAPAVLPISVAEVKDYMRVSHTDDDDDIEALISAAVQHLEGRDGWLGRALIEQTWELTLDEFPKNEIRIPLPPLQEVVSIKYDDANGVEQTLAADSYTVDTISQPGWVLPDGSWPATFDGINAVRVRFTAGYADDGASPPDLTANVPAPIKLAIKRMVATHFEQREDIVIGQGVAAVPRAAEALLAPYRVFSWR